MDASVIVAIAIPSVAIIYNAGIMTQSVRQLQRLVKDLDDRVRKLEGK